MFSLEIEIPSTRICVSSLSVWECVKINGMTTGGEISPDLYILVFILIRQWLHSRSVFLGRFLSQFLRTHCIWAWEDGYAHSESRTTTAWRRAATIPHTAHLQLSVAFCLSSGLSNVEHISTFGRFMGRVKKGRRVWVRLSVIFVWIHVAILLLCN